MIKVVLLTFLILPLTSFASEQAVCTLEADSYSWNLKYEYIYESTETVDVSQAHHNGEVVTLSGYAYPVSYEVTARAFRDLSGSLRVKVDQPGDSDSGTVTADKELKLQVEDNFNGGKVVYRLTCKMI